MARLRLGLSISFDSGALAGGVSVSVAIWGVGVAAGSSRIRLGWADCSTGAEEALVDGDHHELNHDMVARADETGGGTNGGENCEVEEGEEG